MPEEADFSHAFARAANDSPAGAGIARQLAAANNGLMDLLELKEKIHRLNSDLLNQKKADEEYEGEGKRLAQAKMQAAEFGIRRFEQLLRFEILKPVGPGQLTGLTVSRAISKGFFSNAEIQLLQALQSLIAEIGIAVRQDSGFPYYLCAGADHAVRKINLENYLRRARARY